MNRIVSSRLVLLATALGIVCLFTASAVASFEITQQRKYQSGAFGLNHNNKPQVSAAGCPQPPKPVDFDTQALAPTLAQIQDQFQKIFTSRNYPGMTF